MFPSPAGRAGKLNRATSGKPCPTSCFSGTVLVEALNQTVAGQVSAIAPLADTLGGDVVYKTTIESDTHPAALRAGISVEVHFGTSP
jgi:hypothetical protein